MARRKMTEPRESTRPSPESAARSTARTRDVRAAGNQAVQSRLKVGQMDSQAEHEAESAARQVSRGAAAPPSGARADATVRPAPDSVARTLAQPGRSLPSLLRQEMEHAFARDFRGVRVHADGPARESAASIGARAYTHRNDIVLGPGAPSLTSRAGSQLLAHELTHVAQQHDGVIHRQTLESQIPKEVDIKTVSVSLRLPGGKQLTNDWNDLSTTAPTEVTVSLQRSGLTMSFDPPLLIDVQYPWSDLAWSSVVYDFVTGTVTSVGLTKTQPGFDASSDARANITKAITDSLKGSRAATAGYDPMTDANPGETLQKIRGNILSAPSKGSEVGAADITNVSTSAEIAFKSEIRQGDAQGTVVIPAGGTATITADLTGTLADVSAHPKISAVHISSNGITIQQGGEDVAKLKRITVERGGAVRVEDFEPLGKAKTATGGEATANFFALMVALAGGTSADRLAVAGREPHLEATAVPEYIRKKLEEALTKAVIELLQNATLSLPPGVDLYELFGITSPPGDYNLPATGPGATAYG
jgi:hypothetical protein